MPHSMLKRVLCVEDDDGLAVLLKRRLERQRFVVETTRSAESGLEILEKENFDLVLLDYCLPGMNGLEMLDAMAGRPNVLPVVILTSGGDEAVAVAALEKGAADYAVKDAGQSYFDLLPAIMQAAFTKELLLRENERQRHALEAANQAKSNFLATMSHEIRTPLNVVTGLAAMLARTTLDAQQEKIVQTLSAHADLLLTLINDLLDMNRIDSGHMVLDEQAFAFGEIIANIRTLFEAQATQKCIELRLTDATADACYMGDRTRIEQLLINLVGNAVKFTESGYVELVVAPILSQGLAGGVQLHVRDTGIGIAPEKIAIIFDKFTQADPSVTRRYGGSGLGLSIAHSLVQLMGGDIRVQSQPGHGSCFTTTLPLRHAPSAGTVLVSPPIPAEAQCAGAKPSPNPAEILLVEDYAPNIMVARMMLEAMGHDVAVAESGAAAVAMIHARSSPYAAILMDVQMQGMDGLDTTRQIRAIEAQRNYRHAIIGVTAHALADDRERCLAAGMDDYLSKPIQPELLAKKLRGCDAIS